MRQGPGIVDALDARVRMRRAQKLAVRHPRQRQIVRVARLPGHLGARVDAPARHSNYAQFVVLLLFGLNGYDRRLFNLRHVTSYSRIPFVIPSVPAYLDLQSNP